MVPQSSPALPATTASVTGPGGMQVGGENLQVGTPLQHPERRGDHDSAGINCSITDTSSPSSSPSIQSLSSL